MSRAVVAWLLQKLNISLWSILNNRNFITPSYSFTDELEEYIFRRLLQLYNIIGSADGCKDLEKILKEELKDPKRKWTLRMIILDLIKEYLTKFEEQWSGIIRLKKKRKKTKEAEISLLYA